MNALQPFAPGIEAAAASGEALEVPQVDLHNSINPPQSSIQRLLE